MFVFLCVSVRNEGLGAGRRLVVTEQRILNFSWFTVAVREQITEFWTFLVHILSIFDLLLPKSSNDFRLTKKAKFFGGDKIMQKVLHLLGWFTKLFLLSQTWLSFVLKNVESILLFAIQLN